MTKQLRNLGLAIVLSVSGIACGDTVRDFCNRLDSCNYLEGSVDDCTEEGHQDLEDMTSSEAEDLENAIGDCNDKASCDGFASCVGEI